MDKLFINYSGNIESFKRLGLEETYKKRIVFIEKDGAIYTHNAYYAGPDVLKSIQEALNELQAEVKEGDYVASIRQVDGKIETTMGTFEERDSKILEDSKSYTDELKRTVTTAIATEYLRATGAEKNLSERIDSHLDITERALSEKADKDSVYDKDQIDLKLTGVYKIKGSCTFEKLPETNKVGDVYNITNSFTLDEEEHTAGTNIVYTESGWDVLAGIFDTSAIESDIQRVSNLLALEVVRAIKAENDLEDKINEGVARAQEKELELDKKFDNYLPLSGGIIVNTSNSPLKVATTSEGWSGLQCINKNGTLGHIGVWLNGDPVYVPSDLSKGCTILHENNYSNYALPLKGGTINGELKINGNSYKLLEVDRNNDLPLIKFSNNGVACGYIGSLMDAPVFKDRSLLNTYKIYHEGNFNPSDYLPLSGGKLTGNLQIGEETTNNTYAPGIYLWKGDGTHSHRSILGTVNDGLSLSYYNSTASKYGRLKVNETGMYFTTDGSGLILGHKIWHEGNDGEGSGLDADMLDGIDGSVYFASRKSKNIDFNQLCAPNTYEKSGLYHLDNEWSQQNAPFSYGTLLAFNSNSAGIQLASSGPLGTPPDLKYRKRWLTGFSDWKTIAFTDSDITGNAASASKLGELTPSDVLHSNGWSHNFEKDDADHLNIGAWLTAGGTINLPSSDTTYGCLVSFFDPNRTNYRGSQFYTSINNKLHYRLNWNNGNTDWKQVATTDYNGFYDLYGGVEIPANADLNDYKTVGTYCIKYDVNAASVANLPIAEAGTIKVFMSNGGTEYVIQEYILYTGNVTYRRRYQTNDKQWRRWVLISTDLDNYNAPTATKLAKPVRLWGNDFDGSSDVNGTLNDVGFIYFNDQGGDLIYKANSEIAGFERGLSFKNADDTGSGYIGAYGEKGVLKYLFLGKNYTNTYLTALPNGNIGIGTIDPQYKLDVNGLCRVKRSIIINNNEAFLTFDAAGHMLPVIQLNANDNLRIGSGTASYGHNTYVSGNNLVLTYGTANNTGVVLNSSGNITIGESDSAKDNKLYVDGTIKSADKIFINDDEVITEAPSDTTMYARSNKSWVPISGYEDIVSYGVKWEKNATSPICTRIGNPLLHKELPIQSQFRGCIYDYKTGVFKYWLNPNDWSLKEDGTASVLDGTDGDVCVHTPKFYGKSGEDNGYYWVRISLTKIDDSWIEIPEMYIGAYRSTVDRTNSLARSIVNTSTLYRGGTNSTDYDQYLETDPFRTLLGKPATNISRATMRTYCRNNNSEMLSYEQYKWIFYWAYVIEYANFNALAGYNEELTTEGYRQGGLGNGMTTWSDSNWNLYIYYNPITPCGYGNNIGNFTGIKTVTVPAYTGRDGTTSVTEKSYLMPRWRGFDNPFGDIWTNLDGVIILGYVDLDGNPSYKEVYTTTDPTKYGDTLENMLDMNIAGIEIYKAGYTLEFDLRGTAEIIPSAVGASTTTGKCDYHYVLDSSTNYTNLRTLLVGGYANYGGYAGPGFFYSTNGVGSAWHGIGFRMVKEIKD